MSAPAGWGYPPAAVPGGRPDLDQLLRELPPKERRELAGHRERLALQQVAASAGVERLWGVVSCRSDAGAGVMALTDGRLMLSIVNGQSQIWHLPIPLGDVAAVEYEPGGLGQPGCVASVAYGESGVLGFVVGRDTPCATKFLRMAAQRVEAAATSETGASAAMPVVSVPMSVVSPGQTPVSVTPVPVQGAAPGLGGVGNPLGGLIREVLQGVCPGQWTDWRPGAGYSAVIGQVGLLVCYDEAQVRVTAHAIADLAYTPELIADLAELNGRAPLGAFWPRRTDANTWHLVYGYSLFARWLYPASGGTSLPLPDLFQHLPGIVEWGAENLRRRHGGTRPPVLPDSGWQEVTAAF